MSSEIMTKKRKGITIAKSVTYKEFDTLIRMIAHDKTKKGKLRDPKSLVAFLLAYGSGLRISEIVGSEKNDNIPPLKVDNFQMTLSPPQIKIFGKYSRERIVPVPKGWRDWMFRLLPYQMTCRNLQKKFKKYAKKAGLSEEYSFHSLRHGFATRLVEKGVPLTHIQYMLGHSNVKTTSIYIQARPSDALKSYEDLF